MGCCDGNSWKREEKADHRFDFIEIKDFHTSSFGCRMAHMMVWFSTFRSFAILGLDIYTAVGLLLLKSYTTTVAQQTFIAHDITKWIFAGCIILSIVLLIWDWIFAIRIIRRKNISFAFTNLIANRVYSLKSYDHHCLFYKLSSSSHKSNQLAFWVFFSFIGWKRLLLSEGPRQAINALTVFSVLSTRDFSFSPASYSNITPFQWTVLGFMSLSLLIWLFSFARFCIASLLFFPLLCHIQGGLTEFVVRKIDKRIERIIEKARKKRLERYARARASDRDSRSSNGKKQTLTRSKSILKESPTLPSIPTIDEKNVGYAHSFDSDSIYSHTSMTKSSSMASIPTLPRSETLPLYRSATQDDLRAMPHQDAVQQVPTLPRLGPSPPRLLNETPQDRRTPPLHQQRSTTRPLPSYHRQDSYNAPPYHPHQPIVPRQHSGPRQGGDRPEYARRPLGPRSVSHTVPNMGGNARPYPAAMRPDTRIPGPRSLTPHENYGRY